MGACAKYAEIPSYPGQSYIPASAFHWNSSTELSIPPILCTAGQLASSKPAFSHPAAAASELFQSLPLIIKAAAFTPGAAGTIFATIT